MQAEGLEGVRRGKKTTRLVRQGRTPAGPRAATLGAPRLPSLGNYPPVNTPRPICSDRAVAPG